MGVGLLIGTCAIHQPFTASSSLAKVWSLMSTSSIQARTLHCRAQPCAGKPVATVKFVSAVAMSYPEIVFHDTPSLPSGSHILPDTPSMTPPDPWEGRYIHYFYVIKHPSQKQLIERIYFGLQLQRGKNLSRQSRGMFESGRHAAGLATRELLSSMESM